MKAQLAAGKLDLAQRYSNAAKRAVLQALERADNRPVLRDASKEVTVKLKKQAIVSPEFMELWNKIKHKTAYRIDFDTETLIDKCVKEIKEMPFIPKAKIISQNAELQLEKEGIYTTEKHSRSQEIDTTYSVMIDIIRLIASETYLKFEDVIEIIESSNRCQDFFNNPQSFYEQVLEIIKQNLHELAIDGIKYVKLAGQEYYVQQIFDSSELQANLDKNAVQVEHSVYDYIIYDSGVENRFAQSLDSDPDVKMFFNLSCICLFVCHFQVKLQYNLSFLIFLYASRIIHFVHFVRQFFLLAKLAQPAICFLIFI